MGRNEGSGNRSINPSFRRKPESRTLCNRPALFRGISWIPAFAGTTVVWVALIKTRLPWLGWFDKLTMSGFCWLVGAGFKPALAPMKVPTSVENAG